MRLSRVEGNRIKIKTDQVMKHADEHLRRVLKTTMIKPPVNKERKEVVTSLERAKRSISVQKEDKDTAKIRTFLPRNWIFQV